MSDEIELRRYVTPSGKDVLGDWLEGLKDIRTRAKIVARIDRLAAGNFGDCRSLHGGMSELRVDWGPGYRICYAMIGRRRVLLICGGDKGRQSSDIKRALAFLEDYRAREL
jgi:putative addiction module killer protein